MSYGVKLGVKKGTYALLTACLGYWYSKTNMEKLVVEAAESALESLIKSPNLLDWQVGMRLIAFSTLRQDFLNFMERDEFGSYVLLNPEVKASWFRYDGYINDRMGMDLAKILKKTDWWKNNFKKMLKERKNYKVVSTVMEK